MTMDEKQRRTVATEPYAELHLSKIDHLVGESFEHGHLQPAQPTSVPRSNAHSIVSNPCHAGNSSRNRKVPRTVELYTP